jgi:CubicO group peptidase (beta-lactamase class C family)
MRYKIGSNSKQITATAILLLSDEGKISLDDKVARFFPDLTLASRAVVAHRRRQQIAGRMQSESYSP